MANVLKFLTFVIYITSIFFTSGYGLLAVTGINLLLILLVKVDFVKLLKSMIDISLFVIFLVFINILVSDFNTAILIGLKLYLVCIATYIFSYIFSAYQIAEVIEKIFGKKGKDIGIMISIAITFLPILNREINQIKSSMISKGFNINLKTTTFMLKSLVTQTLRRVSEIEVCLRAKGYEE